MPTLQPRLFQGTIPAGLQSQDLWDIGNRVIALKSISMANETRPLADPRPCWTNVIRAGADEGAEICLGNTSQYNDFIKTFSGNGFRVGAEDRIEFVIRGENGDTYKVNVLYEVIKIG